VGSLFLAFHNPDSKAAAEQRIGEAGGEAGCGTIARGVDRGRGSAAGGR